MDNLDGLVRRHLFSGSDVLVNLAFLLAFIDTAKDHVSVMATVEGYYIC